MKLRLYRDGGDLVEFQIQSFISYCKSKNLSPVTIEGYESILKDFGGYLNQHGHLKVNQINQRIISEYLLSLSNKEVINQVNKTVMRVGLSSYAKRNRFASIRVFFNYLVEFGYLNDNPVLKLKSPRLEKRLIETFSIEQIKKILSKPNQKVLYGYRDYTIILMLLDTGLRVSELINIKIEDINWNENLIIVFGKCRKERQVPFSSKLKRVLWKYQQKRSHIENDYLFTDIKGDRLTRNGIFQMISKYGKKAKSQM